MFTKYSIGTPDANNARCSSFAFLSCSNLSIINIKHSSGSVYTHGFSNACDPGLVVRDCPGMGVEKGSTDFTDPFLSYASGLKISCSFFGSYLMFNTLYYYYCAGLKAFMSTLVVPGVVSGVAALFATEIPVPENVGLFKAVRLKLATKAAAFELAAGLRA